MTFYFPYDVWSEESAQMSYEEYQWGYTRVFVSREQRVDKEQVE